MKTPFLQTVREKTVQLCHWLRETRPAQAVLRFFALCERHSFLTQCLLVVLLRLSLDVVYVTVLSPVFDDIGFIVSIDPLFYLCTWLALLAFMPVHVRLSQDRTPSALIVAFLDYLFFIPLTSYCGCSGSDIRFFLIAMVYWAALLFFQLRLPVLTLKRPHLRVSRPLMVGLTVFSCVFILYISGRYTGFRFTLNFIDVYGIRAEAAAYDIPTLFRYILSSMTVVLSFLLLYWMERKKWTVVAPLCVLYLIFYSIDTQKSVFFLLVLILLCRFFYREWMLRWAGGFLSLFCAVGLAEKALLGSFWLVNMFIRRMLYLPVLICQQYGEFFRNNPQNLFRDGIMGKISFDAIYSTRIPRIIGEFRGHPAESANSGLLGDLFANFPIFPGILLLPLILVICFRLLDMTAASLRARIVLPVCFYYVCCFFSGSWSTIMLSNGFLIACFLFYLYPNEEGLSHG